MLTLPGHLVSLPFREFASFHVVEVFVRFLWFLFCPGFVCLRFTIFWIIDFELLTGIWSLSIFVIQRTRFAWCMLRLACRRLSSVNTAMWFCLLTVSLKQIAFSFCCLVCMVRPFLCYFLFCVLVLVGFEPIVIKQNKIKMIIFWQIKYVLISNYR